MQIWPFLLKIAFQIRVDKLNGHWTSSLKVGVVGLSPEKLNFPATASAVKKLAWIVQGDAVFHNTHKVWMFLYQLPHIYIRKVCGSWCNNKGIFFPKKTLDMDTKYFKVKRTLDKYNIIPQLFPKKLRFLYHEKCCYCCCLPFSLTYFWRTMNICSIIHFSKSTSINTWYSGLWDTLGVMLFTKDLIKWKHVGKISWKF